MNFPTPFGRYLLLNKIATGGMAEIFKAKLVGVEGFEKTLVIKRILPFWSEREDFVTMLVDEAKVLVHLNHPNIVQIFELGRVGPTYFIAMEYVEGIDLKKLQNRLKSQVRNLPQEIAISVIIDSLQGLYYAHERSLPDKGNLGIVHRDISPQNILLSFEGEVKVTDFGIAKAITQTHETETGVLKGKYAYMSPEQAMGRVLDHRSDLFSMGIVLWELLFQQRLFASKNDIQTLEKVRKAEVPWPQARSIDLYPGVREALLKSLALRPEDRFQSAEDFAEALEDCLPKGRRLNNRQLAKFFQEVFSEEILARRQQEQERSAASQAAARQTKVAPGEIQETISLVEPPTKIEDELQPKDRGLRFRPPRTRPAKLAPILFGSLWLALAIGLTYIIVGQFQKPGEKSPALLRDTPSSFVAPISVGPSKSNSSPTPTPILGSMTVTVQPPGAQLSAEFDGKKETGVGKLELKDLKEGTEVLVRASLKGYEPGSGKFKISSSQLNVNKTIQLKQTVAQFGSVRVGASPWGTVYLDGYINGVQTPTGHSKIPVGSYRIRVVNKPMGKNASGSIKVRAGRLTTCTVNWKSHRVSCQ